MQFYTLNSLINQFRYVSQNHAQIKGFNFGRDAEIAASEQENYPLLWIDVTDSNIEGTVMTVSILMKVVDIQQPDRENEIENLSDMLSIGQDVYAAMSDPAYQDFFIIQYASSLTPIREAYTDLVNGWEMRLDFSFMQDRNRCQIPTNDIPFPPVATCPKANLTLNGVEFIEAESGQTTNIELVNQNDEEIIPLSVVGSKITVEQLPVGDALELTWDDIDNVPVADASSVSDWNTFFDLPTNGTPFTDVVVDGNVVKLYGGSGITLKANLFLNNTNLVQVNDYLGSVINIGNFAFNGCSSLTNVYFLNATETNSNSFLDCTSATLFDLPDLITAGNESFYFCNLATSFNLPNLEVTEVFAFAFCEANEEFNFPNLLTIGSSTFENCILATLFNLASCVTMGTSVTDASVFDGITGNTITLTVPAALMTCNGGNPHASIQYLIDNNTVTVILSDAATLTLNGNDFTTVPNSEVTDIELVDQNDTPIVPDSVVGRKITVEVNDKTTTIRFTFAATEDTSDLLTIVSGVNNGTYTATTNDGSSGTITFSKNGGAYTSFSSPLVLDNGDTIQVKRTTTTGAGFVQITGTY